MFSGRFGGVLGCFGGCGGSRDFRDFREIKELRELPILPIFPIITHHPQQSPSSPAIPILPIFPRKSKKNPQKSEGRLRISPSNLRHLKTYIVETIFCSKYHCPCPKRLLQRCRGYHHWLGLQGPQSGSTCYSNY